MFSLSVSHSVSVSLFVRLKGEKNHKEKKMNFSAYLFSVDVRCVICT